MFKGWGISWGSAWGSIVSIFHPSYNKLRVNSMLKSINSTRILTLLISTPILHRFTSTIGSNLYSSTTSLKILDNNITSNLCYNKNTKLFTYSNSRSFLYSLPSKTNIIASSIILNTLLIWRNSYKYTNSTNHRVFSKLYGNVEPSNKPNNVFNCGVQLNIFDNTKAIKVLSSSTDDSVFLTNRG